MKKILLLVTTLFYLLNSTYAQSGTLDSSFGKKGTVAMQVGGQPTSFERTVIQKNGKIIALGKTSNGTNINYFIARYNSDGSVDKTFGNNGILVIDSSRYAYTNYLTVQKDGKILVTKGGVMTRYNTDGTVDRSFSEDGKQTTDFGIAAIAIQADEKIVAAGTYDSVVNIGGGEFAYYYFFAIGRYNPDGSADKTFNNGKMKTFQVRDINSDDASSYASSVAVQPNGKIVIAGMGGVHPDPYFSIARLNANGSLDSSFDEDGKKSIFYANESQSFSATLQPDGKIVTLGYFSYRGRDGVVIHRLNDDGSFDTSFNGTGFKETPLKPYSNSEVNTIVAGNDGIIVLADTTLFRYNYNGSSDSTFGDNGRQVPPFNTKDIALADNKLYIAGGNVYGNIARYLLDNTNTPPTVTLTTPANNATYLAPAAHIKLSAAAADSDGTITKVEFYNGATLLHTETVIPYGFVWRNVPLGNYTITAKAYDNSGNVTSSAPIHISVVPNKAPIVSIVTPANSQNFTAPASIRFEAAASDTDGRITNVKFYNGSTLLRIEYQAPYTYNWANVPVGSYTITAVATDNWGAQTTFAPVTVSVTNAAIVGNRPFAKNEKIGLNDALNLKVYPNPATTVINIAAIGLQQGKPTTVSVISAAGVTLKTIQAGNSAKNIQLNVSALAQGVYTIKLVSGEKVSYRQFVKQ